MESRLVWNQALVWRVASIGQYEDNDIFTYQDTCALNERKLREEVKRVLQENDAYSNDLLYDVMAALKSLGVSSTRHFEHITTEDLCSKGLQQVAARILMKEFVRSCDESNSPDKNHWFWDHFYKILESANLPAVLTFIVDLLKAIGDLVAHFKPHKAA